MKFKRAWHAEVPVDAIPARQNRGWCSGVRVRVPDCGSWLQVAGCRVQGAGCRVQGAGCRVQGAGFRVQDSGFRIQGSGHVRECAREREGGRRADPIRAAQRAQWDFNRQLIHSRPLSRLLLLCFEERLCRFCLIPGCYGLVQGVGLRVLGPRLSI